MSAIFVMVAIVLIFAFGREYILVEQTGWVACRRNILAGRRSRESTGPAGGRSSRL
jgi:hypothetical protein